MYWLRFCMVMVGFGLVSSCSDAGPEPVVLVRQGEPLAVIVLPDRPHDLEQQAAYEIATYIEKISGAKFDWLKDLRVS